MNFATLASCLVYDKMGSCEYQDGVQNEELIKLPKGSTAAKKLSTETGVNINDPEAPRSHFTDLITPGESARVAVAEILHLDPLVRLRDTSSVP